MAAERLLGLAAAALLAGLSTACTSMAPPSQFPTGQAALDRMKSTFDCLRGVQAEAKLDHRSDQGRLRGSVSFFAVEPAMVRFDVISPFGVSLATLTSDGRRFSFSNLREKKFFEGPASACNIARLTDVPIPGHALVYLLHGEAPLLVHKPADVTIRWSSSTRKGGYYVVTLPGANGYEEEVELQPVDEDFAKPWSAQRLRVLDMRVHQGELELYHAELGDYAVAEMSKARVDEDNIEAPLPPSGPMCSIEVPRRLHVEVGTNGDDVLFKYESTKLNPPLPEGVFTQPVPGGVERVQVGECDR